MFNSVEEIKRANQELNEMQQVWFDNIVWKVVEEKALDKSKLTAPFFSGISNETGKKIILFVGQEVAGYGTFNDNTWHNAGNGSKWSAYNTLVKRKFPKEEIKELVDWNGAEYNFKSTQFWNFFNKFEKEKYSLVWTNLDKLSVDGFDDDFKNKILDLNEKFVYNGKNLSILQHEIDIINPDLVVFLTGNKKCYINSMKGALDIQDLSNYPYYKRKNKQVCDIIKEINGTKYLWTYHPRGLQTSGLWNEVVDEIKKKV